MKYKLTAYYVNGKCGTYIFNMDKTLKDLEDWMQNANLSNGFHIPSDSFDGKNGFVFININHVLDFSIMKMEE